MRQLILASTSRYRRALLERLTSDFSSEAPKGVDERSVELPPKALAEHLAQAKALSVANEYKDAIVIGSDQVAALGDSILHKPGTVEKAREQLKRLSGKQHQLITSMCVIDTQTGRKQQHTDVHLITLRKLTDEEIANYVERDKPLDCAGSYKIEGLGIALMDHIKGDDFTAIVGLPLAALTRMLKTCGFNVLGSTL